MLITTKNKCNCGNNYILTIAGWKCPTCELKSLQKTKRNGGSNQNAKEK